MSDTGIGIPADSFHRLFQSFSQIDGSMTRRHSGAGLGLAIARHLVELMGGEIGAESVKEHGSTFWFTVNLECAHGAIVERPSLPTALHGEPVLVVSDHGTVRRTLARRCRSWGLEAARATPTRQAVAELRAAMESGRPFRAVLLDLRRPETDLALVEAIADERGTGGPAVVLLVPLAGPDSRPLDEPARSLPRFARPWPVSRLRAELARILAAARAAA